MLFDIDHLNTVISENPTIPVLSHQLGLGEDALCVKVSHLRHALANILAQLDLRTFGVSFVTNNEEYVAFQATQLLAFLRQTAAPVPLAHPIITAEACEQGTGKPNMLQALQREGQVIHVPPNMLLASWQLVFMNSTNNEEYVAFQQSQLLAILRQTAAPLTLVHSISTEEVREQ